MSVNARWMCSWVLSLALVGCGDVSGGEDAGGAADAGQPADAGARDAAMDDAAIDDDAGPADAGARDAGGIDAGTDDAGVDGGPADGGGGDAGAPDGGACSYLDLGLWIGDCGGSHTYIRHWTDTGGVCPEYFTVGSARYDTLEAAMSTHSCERSCLRAASTSVSLIRCGVRTGYIVYRDEGEDCPELLETPDGLFESVEAWDDAFPCPE